MVKTKEKEIAAGEFKTKCLALLDEVARTGETLIVTKRGKPVAKLTPVEPPPEPDRQRPLRGRHHFAD